MQHLIKFKLPLIVLCSILLLLTIPKLTQSNECQIDTFILEHLGIEHCVGDPLNEIIKEPQTAPTQSIQVRAAIAGSVPFSDIRSNFVHWETPHVHPIDLTPNGNRLLAVNTADNSLMVFNATGDTLRLVSTIPVGLAPVSVRARTNNEAWVVNHVSDTISIVNLNRRAVVATLNTDDEPADVVFAGSRAFVSCSQENTVLVYNVNNRDANPQRISINGEDPRALAVSNDGSEVYAAIFESGNATTILSGGRRNNQTPNVVDNSEGPYEGQNPPPNAGNNFNPTQNSNNPIAPRVGLIVRKNENDRWMDDNNGDWTRFVSGDLADSIGGRVAGWDLPDRDVAIIDTSSLNVTYQHQLMNMVMALDVHPVTGQVTTVGTDATNEIRYISNLQGRFLRVNSARFTPGNNNSVISDLNPHLTYTEPRVRQGLRNQSIGDPRAIKWNSAGSRAYIAGMGSNNVIVLNRNGNRVGRIEVGEGPTGIALQESNNRAFVLNKFTGSISVINLNNNSQSEEVSFFDPTPTEIKEGRPHLYDTHATSGLGHISCASCHVDARTDRLAWDLGDPAGSMTDGIWHPMKGAMLTQPIMDIIRGPNLHWRGEVNDITHFAAPFEQLQGDNTPLPDSDMAELVTFLDSISILPNPYRNLDNSLPTEVVIPSANNDRVGNAQAGFENNCFRCHTGDIGRSERIFPGGGNSAGQQPIIAPSLRNLYDRMGYSAANADASNTGYGFLQDGVMGPNVGNTLRNNDNMAFLMAFNGGFPSINENGFQSQDTHAAVGRQVTINGTPTNAQRQLLNQLIAFANQNEIGVIAKGNVANEERGYLYIGNQRYQSDRSTETITHTQLLAVAQSSPITFSAVPWENRVRNGIDRDNDTILDNDDANKVSVNPFACYSTNHVLRLTERSRTKIPTISLSGDFTIEAMVRLTRNQLVSNRDGIVHDGNSNQDINFFNSQARLFSRNDGRNLIVARTPTQPNVWTHYAFVRTNGTLGLYINGQLDRSSNNNWTEDFVISEIGSAVAGSLHGQMDELRIWNVARSQSEIDSNRSSSLANVNNPDLIAYYKFNDNDSIIRDASGNGFHSSLALGGSFQHSTAHMNDSCPSLPLPLAAWHFDESSWGSGARAVRDSTNNNRHGTANGDVSTQNSNPPLSGSSGSCRYGEFDGVNDWVALGNPNQLNFSGEITLAAWIRPDRSDNRIRNIIDHSTQENPERAAVFLRLWRNQYQVGSWNGRDRMAVAAIPAGDVNTGEWVHLAGVYDGSMWRLYRNGTQIGTQTTTLGSIPVNVQWAIGAQGSSGGRLFDGGIDEPRIYNVALSRSEIRALMNERRACNLLINSPVSNESLSDESISSASIEEEMPLRPTSVSMSESKTSNMATATLLFLTLLVAAVLGFIFFKKRKRMSQE